MNKKIIILLVVILLVPFVIAEEHDYKRICLSYGQELLFSLCNPVMGDRTCWSSLCQYCVYEKSEGIYCPSALSKCNDIEGCEVTGNSTIDESPPELTINSPENNSVYNSRKVLFDIESNEPCSLYYIDNINGRGLWKRMSSRTTEYYRTLSFKDGFADITIRATDRHDNTNYYALQFRVDSKKPRIRRTYPRRSCSTRTGRNLFRRGYYRYSWYSRINPIRR